MTAPQPVSYQWVRVLAECACVLALTVFIVAVISACGPRVWAAVGSIAIGVIAAKIGGAIVDLVSIPDRPKVRG